MTQPRRGQHDDTLGSLLALQRGLQRFYARVRGAEFYTATPPLQRCLTWVRAIWHEVAELDDELNWKPWKNPRDLSSAESRARRLEETVDVLFFWLNLVNDQGFTAEEVVREYRRKWAENTRRQTDDPRYAPALAATAAQPTVEECAATAQPVTTGSAR